jgi:hypothetical protein
MSKNKPMTRIDLDYNKNLKYPDINDYLNDTVYASNLTEFPDNQAGARTSFRLIPGTTEWNHKISLAGFSWRIFLGQFKLYGYNPDLEAIEKMQLTIDFVNNQNESNNYVKVIKKRHTDITFNVITPADPESLPLVGAVNFFINFTPTVLEDIYNYVFSTRWVDASEHYRKKVYSGEPDETEKLAFVEFVKYRIYNMKIPVSVKYYYVNAIEPGGSLDFEITLLDLLPTYKNSVDFSSKVIEINNKPTAGLFDYLKLSYTSSNAGKMQIKGFFAANPAVFESEPAYRPVGTVKEEVAISTMVKQLIRAQHSGFDLIYPIIKYTYDFAVGVDAIPLLNDEEFDTFQPAPKDDRVDALTITSYNYGHRVRLVNPGKNNPFEFTVEFDTFNGNLTAEPHRYKFQIQFLQELRSNVIDENPILTTTLGESAFIAGDFSDITGKTLRTITDSVERGSATIHRCNTIVGNNEAFRLFSQRVGTKESSLFSQAALSEFTTKLEKVKVSDDRKLHSYQLTLTWPQSVKLPGLYNILKSKWIRLSIANVFQEIILQGTTQKKSWDRISVDAQNPAYITSLDYYPNYKIQGIGIPLTAISKSVQYPEVDRINSLKGGTAVSVNNFTQVAMYEPATLGATGVINMVIGVQNYIYNNVNTYSTTPNPFFILNSYIVIATRLVMKSGGFEPLATFRVTPKDKILYARDYLKYSTAESTNTIYVAIDPKQLEKAAQVALSTAKLNKGEYTAYLVSNLNAVPNAEDTKIYTNAYVSPGKFKCDLIIGYRWSVVK